MCHRCHLECALGTQRLSFALPFPKKLDRTEWRTLRTTVRRLVFGSHWVFSFQASTQFLHKTLVTHGSKGDRTVALKHKALAVVSASRCTKGTFPLA